MTRFKLICVTFSCLLAIGCNKAKDKDNEGSGASAQSDTEKAEVLAQIDTFKITVGDFQDRINNQSPYIRARYTSLERKKEFLDNLIRFEVLAKEAKKQGLDSDPEVVRTMKQVMIQKLMKKEFETRVKLEDITDPEMKKFYDEHTVEYNKPEEVRVSAIVLAAKAAADRLAKEASGPKGKDNRGFIELVTKNSVDETTKRRGGDLRYFPATSTDYPPEVVAAAFKLTQTGEVAGPIKGGDKFYIIKKTGHRKALSKSFEDVKRQIQNRIYREKRTQAMEDFVKGLRDGSNVKVFEDKLDKVIVEAAPPMQPPGFAPPGQMQPGARLPGQPPGMRPPTRMPHPGVNPSTPRPPATRPPATKAPATKVPAPAPAGN